MDAMERVHLELPVTDGEDEMLLLGYVEKDVVDVV